ncbi:MAG: hypothetical protein NT031_10455 [Planctomycetota bacterium]|nr:hypothetical protein [Planctomycetota bacterium]
MNNDGLHGYDEVSGRVELQPGIYPLAVGCFQGRWGDDLKVFYQPPGREKQPIPPGLFWRGRSA